MSDGLGGARWAGGHGAKQEHPGSVLTPLKSSPQDGWLSSHIFFQPEKWCCLRLCYFWGCISSSGCAQGNCSAQGQPGLLWAQGWIGFDFPSAGKGSSCWNGPCQSGPRLSSGNSKRPKSTGLCGAFPHLMLHIFPCSVLAPAESPDNAGAAV